MRSCGFGAGNLSFQCAQKREGCSLEIICYCGGQATPFAKASKTYRVGVLVALRQRESGCSNGATRNFASRRRRGPQVDVRCDVKLKTSPVELWRRIVSGTSASVRFVREELCRDSRLPFLRR